MKALYFASFVLFHSLVLSVKSHKNVHKAILVFFFLRELFSHQFDTLFTLPNDKGKLHIFIIANL